MERHVFIILLVGLLGVSFGAPLARFVPEMAALTVAFWRMAGGSIMLWSSAAIKPQGPLDRKQYPFIVIAGVFLALHFVSFYTAVKLVPIANATLFATLAPIFTLMYERIILKRKLSWGAILGLWFAIGGAIIIQGNSLRFSSAETTGNLIALASSAFMSVVLVIAERTRSSITTIMYTRWLYLFAALTLAAIGISLDIDLRFTFPDAKWILALVILPTLIGHNSMSYAVKYLRPTIVGSMPFGEPVLATMLAWLFFSESIEPIVALGGAVTLIGLVIITRNRNSDDVRAGSAR